MKYRYFITLFIFFLFVASANALDFDTFKRLDANQFTPINKATDLTPERLEELNTFLDKATKAKPRVLTLAEVNRDCSHCPKHLQVTNDVNQILEAMKKDPKIADKEEIPININRLNFMFYEIKAQDENGQIGCARFMDHTNDLKPTRFDGEMEMMAENVFKFEAPYALQIMDPKKESVTYYYRGEGSQKNIIVQAILTKDGGKFRYYYYRPTEREKNPYGLPSMGSYEEPADDTVKKAAVPKLEQPEFVRKNGPRIEDKNKFSFDVDPTLETRWRVVPKNVSLAKAALSQNIGGINGVRVSGDSKLSLKGNEAVIDVTDEGGHQYVRLEVNTGLNGSTTQTVTIPYEISLGASDDKEAMKVKGVVVDSTTNQAMNFTLTGGAVTYLRSEYKKDKTTDISTFAIAKDFSLDKDEMATVAVGTNELKSKYVSLQHRKAVKDNVTMVLDVRVDENKRATLTYQLKARF